MHSQTLPTLVTERLTLRKLSKKDAGEILQLRADPAINKFLDRKPSQTLQDALNFISGIIESQSNGLFYWAITKTGQDTLIGTICLFGFSDEIKQCEIGYELLTGYHGQGIMAEAAQKVVSHAREVLGMTAIEALTHKDNHSSTKLLQKLNFRKSDDRAEDNPNLILFRLESQLQ